MSKGVSNNYQQMAIDIAKLIDAKEDNDNHNTIEAKTWNIFVGKGEAPNERIGTRKSEIKSEISIFDAQVSIKQYLNKNGVEKVSNALARLGINWNPFVENNDKIEISTKQEENANAETQDIDNVENDTSAINQSSKSETSISSTMSEQDKQNANNALDKVKEELQQQIIARQDNLKDVSNGVNQVAQINSEKVEEVVKANEKKKKEIITNLIKEEAISRGLNNDKLNKIDFEKVTDIIYRCSNSYNIDPKIIISIIGQETGGYFNCPVGKNGAGPMQLTTSPLIDMINEKGGNWGEIYRSIDPSLYDEIINHTRADGTKCANAKEMREECGKDPEYGIKVGILVFKLKYVKAVTQKLYNSSSIINIKKCIEKMNSSVEPLLSEQDNKKCLNTTIRNYNGNVKFNKKTGHQIRDDYAKKVMSSLKRQSFEYSNMLQGNCVV